VTRYLTGIAVFCAALAFALLVAWAYDGEAIGLDSAPRDRRVR
jgi:hypothetical protein